MKKLMLASSIIASVLFAGCPPSNRTDGTVGATATTNGACPAGYWYSSNGLCTNGVTTISSAFSYNTGFYADNYSGGSARLSIVNQDAMKQFLKYAMGVCDRGQYDYQNLGTADCSYFINGYTDIIIQFPPQLTGNALLTVIARPRTNPFINYSGQLPSIWGMLGLAIGYTTGIYVPDFSTTYQGPYRNPLQIQMNVSPINNNAGFLAQGYGDPYYGSYPPEQMVVGVEVANGNANSTTMNYSFKVKGVTAATGVLARCQFQNCGL